MNIYKISLSIGVFISLLIVLTLSTYIFLALNNFYDYQNKVNSTMQLTLDNFHFFLKNEIKKEYAHITAPKLQNDKDSPLVTFHISAKQEDIKSLNENLPTSGKDHFIDAQMFTNDKKYKIKLRYRGDTNLHWFNKQKSMRIKLLGNDVYNMDKQFNLNNSPNWSFHRDMITYKFAKKLGFLSPDYFPARVFLNGNFMGIYMYLSQIDESFLRKNKVMPGSIYYGDDANVNKNGVKNVWDKEEYWKKKSSRNAEQKNNREDINYFIKFPYIESKQSFYSDFYRFFDVDKFTSFMALDRLFGTGHHDFYHNHKIYFDPYKGKFEPIEWDMRNWFITDKKDISLYPLLLKIKENPILDAIIDKKVYTLIENNISSEIKKEIDNIYSQVKDDLKSDYYKDNGLVNSRVTKSWITTPFSDAEYEKWIHQDRLFINTKISKLTDIYNRLDLQYNIYQIKDNKYKIDFMLNGESPVEIKFKNFLTIRQVKENNFYSDVNSTTIYPGRKIKKNIRKKNIKIYGRDDVINVPQYYEFVIQTNDLKLFEKNMKFTNKITNKEVSANLNSFIVNYDDEILHPLDLLVKGIKKIDLSGNIRINKTLIFDKNTIVNISPGTIFSMDANMSIFFYGKVFANGSKNNPIKFLASNELEPWGAITVQGKHTGGSKFTYCEFENGSISTRNMIHYTSPFNIHDMDWFEIKSCKIGANHIGDDAMHIAYAKGIVDDCKFINARSDGLDIDISDVNITNNIFYNSGNDGLDIMTTTMNASNNVFINMGDKGISVGEWSNANITDSFFLGTVIGTEIKDKSKVKANNLIYVDSKEKAINLYNKNKRYNTGGFLEADNIYLLGNTKVKIDQYSKEKIENKIKNKLPNLEQFEWYTNIKNTKYKNFIDEVKVRYAQ